MTAVNAANVLGLSRRQVHSLLKSFQSDGPAAIRHKARGRASNNRIDPAVREFAVTLVRENYIGFGPTFAAEKLEEEHGLKVSRETLRKWMQDAGIWLSRKQRRTFHQPRLRGECYGELIQIDGSDHRWFEDRGDPCTLLVFIDDASSTLMELRFVTSESTFSYFEALESYLLKHGRPVAFYSDKHTVFRVPKPNEHMTGMTQFGRALAELNIEIICANSSQAKGRVERANRTLQDRLVKELRIAGISDMEDGNAFLGGFMESYNAKFAKPPAKPDNLHRLFNTEPDRLADVLCWRPSRQIALQSPAGQWTNTMSATNWPSPTTDSASSSQRTRSRAACPANMSTATSFRMDDWSSAGRGSRSPTPFSTRTSASPTPRSLRTST
jgi:transposase